MKLTLLQFEKAFKNLPESYYCKVDMEKGVIETIDEAVDKVMSEKISGERFN